MLYFSPFHSTWFLDMASHISLGSLMEFMHPLGSFGTRNEDELELLHIHFYVSFALTS